MSRIDKYEPLTGGFRAPLAANFAVNDLGKILPVSLDANGRVVVAAVGNSGFVGVIILTSVKNAGDIVDVMQDGDVVEFSLASAPGNAAAGAAGVAGTNYFVDAATGLLVAGTGARTATAPATAGSKYVGTTVEATRLEVRFGRTGG